MALRSRATYLRSMLGRLTTYSSAKTKPYDRAIDIANNTEAGIRAIRGDYFPVYVSLGFIMLSLTLGSYTAFHQLSRSPNVFVNKKRREMIAEVVEPEKVVDEVDRFINESFFRKVAHVQDSNLQHVMPDPVHRDAFAWRREPSAVTLKDVGVGQ